MAKFDIRLTPESKRKINALAKAGKIDLRPTLSVIGIGYRKEVRAIFDKQQPRGEGQRWDPLSEQYAKWKEKHFPGRPLLVRTGALRDSMTIQGATGNITIISKTSATFGSLLSYGIYHDSDEPRTSNLPRRNFSDPSDRRMEIWDAQIEKEIIKNFEKQGIQVTGKVVL